MFEFGPRYEINKVSYLNGGSYKVGVIKQNHEEMFLDYKKVLKEKSLVLSMSLSRKRLHISK